MSQGRAAVDWYVAYTGVKAERQAAEELQRRGYPVFLPMQTVWTKRRGRRVKDASPLFPRYLFVGISGPENWFDPRGVNGLKDVLKNDGRPLKVRQDVIDALHEAVGYGCFDETQPKAITAGMRGRFVRGAFGGMDGICAAVVSEICVKVLIELFGMKVTVLTSVEEFAVGV